MKLTIATEHGEIVDTYSDKHVAAFMIDSSIKSPFLLELRTDIQRAQESDAYDYRDRISGM